MAEISTKVGEDTSVCAMRLILWVSRMFRYDEVQLYLLARNGFTKGCTEAAGKMGNVALVSYKDILRRKSMVNDHNTELWDAYYPDGTLAGCDLIRGEKIPQGLRHVVAEVFVMHQDGDILLMQRDFDKPNYPGCWESGAGGSVLKGECVIDGARRELLEETGIVADDSLERLYHTVSDTSIYQGYLYVTDIPKENVKLQKGETIAFRWVNKQEFREIFHSDQYVGGLRERLRGFVENDFRK